MITRTDVLAQLERNLRVGFLKAQKQYVPLRSGFAREAPSDGAFETYGDMGAVPWPRANAGQPPGTGTDGRTGHPQVGGLHEGGPVTMVGGHERGIVVYNRDWDIMIGISHSAINDNRVGSLEEWAQMAGTRFEQHKDFLCFDALNQGEGTTYGNAYDGGAMFRANHADIGAEYQTGQDNQFALALSMDNFETVYIASTKYLDGRGQPVGYSPDLLVHPPDLMRTAAQISDNEWTATTSYEINPYRGIQRVEAPGGYLDSTAWFVIVSNLPQKPVILQNRQAPVLAFWDDHSQGAGFRFYKWVARYEVAYGDWRLATQGNT